VPQGYPDLVVALRRFGDRINERCTAIYVFSGVEMTFDDLLNYCMAKKGVAKDFPFDKTTLVYRVVNKIFALTDIAEKPLRINLKCDPILALELREEFEAIEPGYHMNKKHWNTVIFNGSIEDRKLEEMIDHSYDLVVKGLKKDDREILQQI